MSKRREFIKTAAAAGLALAAAGKGAGAQAHGEDNDDFIRTVLRARIFDLSHTWDENSPIAGVNPPYAMALNATHATLTITDDGVGFDAERQRRTPPNGVGLLGMRERVAYHRGWIDIRSRPREGVRITLSIPIAEGATDVAV